MKSKKFQYLLFILFHCRLIGKRGFAVKHDKQALLTKSNIALVGIKCGHLYNVQEK